MLFWAMKWVIMSVVLILVLHHLYIYFMDTLTVPMNKDFIHKPVEKYKEMLDTIHTSPTIVTPNNVSSLNNIIPTTSPLPSDAIRPQTSLDTTSMQNELQTFLNELKQDKHIAQESQMFTMS
tara:strand:+ start:816 stop:1181 length:366 start_codon:yes stop_codon:yes gene_type:complete